MTRLRERLDEWLHLHGFRYYCHRCARTLSWHECCDHKPRWYR